jgi:hypothetical protein
MNIDIRTLILVVGIIYFLQVITILFQYLINRPYQGIGWWLLGFSSVATGHLLPLLRDATTIEFITITAANTLTVFGPV